MPRKEGGKQKKKKKAHRFVFETYQSSYPVHSFLRLYIIYNRIINKPRVSDTPLACIDFRCATLLVIFKRYVLAVINSIESMQHDRGENALKFAALGTRRSGSFSSLFHSKGIFI